MKRLVLLLLIPLISTAGGGPGMVVFDPSNWAENVKSAVSSFKMYKQQLLQVKRQLEELKLVKMNSATYKNGVWGKTTDALSRLGNVVNQGQAVAYNMGNLNDFFKQRYPGYKPTEDYEKSYQLWTSTTLDTLRGTLRSAGLQADDFINEKSVMNRLYRMSNTSKGRMQVLQVANMIAAQQDEQMRKLRQLMIAQTNAQNVYMAYKIQNQVGKKANQDAWLGTGDEDFPQYDDTAGFGLQDVPFRRRSVM